MVVAVLVAALVHAVAGVTSADAGGAQAYPGGVRGLRAAAVIGGTLVSWECEGAASLAGFRVERATSPDGPWQACHEGWLTTMPYEPLGYSITYRDRGAAGSNVLYRLTAQNARGLSVVCGPVGIAGPLLEVGAEGTPDFNATPRRTASSLEVGTETGAVADGGMASAATGGTPADKVKVRIVDSGLYSLSAAGIAAAAGWDTNETATLVAERRLRLANRGRKCAYVPGPGGNSLYFFNQWRPDIYSGEEIYWLERGRGIVLPGATNALGDDYQPVAATFLDTFHYETNSIYTPGAFSDPEADIWFCFALTAGSAGSTSLWVRLPSAASGPGAITVRMAGATSTGFAGEHHAIVSVNGVQVGEATWQGMVANRWTYEIPAGVLSNGLNRVTLRAVLDPGIPYSYIMLDWFDISYNRAYVADGNRLLCSGTAEGPVTVTGFSDPDVLVLNVTDRDMPALLLVAPVVPTNGAFAVSFAGAGSNAAYFACARSAIAAATNMSAYVSAGLRSASNRADYVAFSVPTLTNSLERLLAYRRGGGWTPGVVLTQQAYDEFNYGRLSPHALRRCLAHGLTQWSLKPAQTLLAGRGTFDYRNFRGYGTCLVPTMMVTTPDGLFASDNRLADVLDDDGVPDTGIGRFSATSGSTLSNLINKAIAFDSAAPGAWQTNVLFAADNADESGNFTASSESVASVVPATIGMRRAHLASQSLSVARGTIRTNLNSGVAFMNYFGHAGWYGLAEEKMLSQSDFASLTNRTTPTVFTGMTCLISRFEMPGVDSFSEQLLWGAPGGIGTIWSATGLSYNNLAEMLGREFYLSRYQEGIGTLGDAVRWSLNSGREQGVARFELDIMVLLGDPALQLR